MTIGVLIGIGLSGRFTWLAWRLIRFGRSVFEMAEIPGVVGGTLGGLIHTRVHIPAGGGFRVQLQNRLRQRVVRRHGNRTVHTIVESTLWEDEIWVERETLEADRTRSAIPVYFEIPYECKPTSNTDPMNQFLWKLKVVSELPGVDYQAEFEVPVFRTEKSRSDFIARRRGGNALSSIKERERDWEKAGIVLNARQSSLYFHNTPGYLYLYNYVGLGVCAVMMGVAAALFSAEFGVLWLAGGGDVLVGAYLACYSLDLVLGLREMAAAPHGLTMRFRCLGYLKDQRFIPGEIEGLEVQEGNGVCRIQVRLRDRSSPMRITHYVRDYAAARELADRIEEILVKPEPRKHRSQVTEA